MRSSGGDVQRAYTEAQLYLVDHRRLLILYANSNTVIFSTAVPVHTVHTVPVQLYWIPVPHHIQGEGPEPPPPVQIGFGAEPRGFSDIMVNLSGKIPDFSQRFQRIIEIVINNEAQKEKSRNHYREYRRRQYEIHTHNIG